MKKQIRREMRARRDALPEAQREEWSAQICARVIASPAYHFASVIHSYLPFGSEADVLGVIRHALANGKRVVAPLFVKGSERTDAYEVSSLDGREFSIGDWGLRVPRVARLVPLDEIDLVLVPLLAFAADSRTGGWQRVGYGIGYYDRLLARTRPDAQKVGVAFAVQCSPTWAAEPHDIALDTVITNDIGWANC
jgi:5-formyltetrahydrofolate cyclo-ligase